MELNALWGSGWRVCVAVIGVSTKNGVTQKAAQ